MRKLQLILALTGFWLAYTLNPVQAQPDGKTLFEQNCTSCHQIDQKMVGPALKGVTNRWDSKDTLIKFIQNSQEVIKGGHEYANKLFEEYNQTIMPPNAINDEETEAILTYIEEAGTKQAQADAGGEQGKSESMAATKQGERGGTALLLFAILILGLFAILITLIVVLINLTNKLKRLEEPTPATRAEAEPKATWGQLFRKSDVIKDQEMKDHEYDGITEYDNNPPSWFNWLFYGSIAFAVIYMLYFHVLGIGSLQIEEYEEQIAEAKAKYGSLEKTMDFAAYDPLKEESAIQKGKTIYMNNCANCHKDHGGGGVGPNLTDKYWIHGGEFKDILATIYNGVPEKGMVAWKDQLSDKEIHQVASFVQTLRGTDPPEAKEPQGEKYEPQ